MCLRVLLDVSALFLEPFSREGVDGLTSKYPKLPQPPNQPSVLIGEIHSEDTPQNEPWTTRLRPPTHSLENGSKRRAETSSKTLKPTRRYRKKSNNIEPIRRNLNEHIYYIVPGAPSDAR